MSGCSFQEREKNLITGHYGVYEDLSNEAYHGDKNSISRSGIMDFDQSPYTYWAKNLNPKRPDKHFTPQMCLGFAFHTLILEPEKFYDEYVMKPEPVLLKNAGREAYAAYKKLVEELENTNKKIMSAIEWNNLMAMRDRLNSNKDAMELIQGARIEHSLFWKDEGSKLTLKARPDIWHRNLIVDLKTTSNASPREFQYEIKKYGYHIQFAMIRDGIEKIENHRINNFIDLIIESKYPHNMATYIVSEDAINEGEEKYKNICLNMKKALEENNFPDYGIQTVGLPRWAI